MTRADQWDNAVDYILTDLLFQTKLCDGNTTSTLFNPLPHMPIFGSSNSAANKDMMS